MVLIYQVLTRQCLKKVFFTSNDFVPNDSSLLNPQTRKFKQMSLNRTLEKSPLSSARLRRRCHSTFDFKSCELLSSRIINEKLTEQSVLQVCHFKAAALTWDRVRVNEPEEWLLNHTSVGIRYNVRINSY